MKHRLLKKFLIIASLTFLLSFLPANVQAEMTFTESTTGTYGNSFYEFWKDGGKGTMTLHGGGTFSCTWWDEPDSAIFSVGRKFGSLYHYTQYGNIYLDYNSDFKPNGNAYLGVYGWTQEPLVEYYIIENYGIWKPPGSNEVKGYVSADGGIYEIYETTRVDQPSIEGTKTFQQYWSVRIQKRSRGTISVHEHFKQWEAKGMKLGKLYEVSMIVEAHENSGTANVSVAGLGIEVPDYTPTPTPSNSGTLLLGDVDQNGTINSLDFATYRFYLVGKIDSLPAEADINQDGSLDSLDYSMLRQHLLGKIDLSTLTPTATPTDDVEPTPTPTTNNVQEELTFTKNSAGYYKNYNYELWRDTGNTVMTLQGEGAFSCSWDNVNNAIFNICKRYGSTQYYFQYGPMYVNYDCNFQANGSAYLGVHGWTQGPLVEYYIIENYGTWKPPGSNELKGYVYSNGAQYEIYETTKIDQPSIEGIATFKQYWSICTEKRSKGTIDLYDHFRAWESNGMKLGKLFEIGMSVEACQSSGSAELSMDISKIGKYNYTPTPYSTPTPVIEKNALSKIEAEDYDEIYGSDISSIGTGVGNINNGDYIKYNSINFGNGVHTFKAYVANGHYSEKTIQLRLGSPSGQLIGILKVPSTGEWDIYEEISTTVSSAKETKDLYLCFDGPLNIDYFSFGAFIYRTHDNSLDSN